MPTLGNDDVIECRPIFDVVARTLDEVSSWFRRLG